MNLTDRRCLKVSRGLGMGLGYMLLLAVFPGILFGQEGSATNDSGAESMQSAAAMEQSEGGSTKLPGEGVESMSMAGSSTASGARGFPASPESGALAFNTDLFSGSFTYSVPIAVPPARQGAEPSLGLGYSSAAGNGWCGVGWSLGVGFIQRDTRDGVPIAWSGTVPANYYDDGFGFVASIGGKSVRLVHVSGSEYRADVEDGSFLRFEYQQPGWKVVDKSGNEFFFGQSAQSRMENVKFPSGLGSSTFQWNLEKIVDVNGNLTEISYSKDGEQAYLAEVRYNGSTAGSLAPMNTVTFNLEAQNRADKTIAFSGGYRVETRKRLGEILVKAGGALVRRYVLEYETSPATLRSRLKRVRQFGNDSLSELPPVTFTYQEKPMRFGDLIDWTDVSSSQSSSDWRSIRSTTAGSQSSYQNTDLVDMDGDGLVDRLIRDDQDSTSRFFAQRNKGLGSSSGSFTASTLFTWNPVDHQGNSYDRMWTSLRGLNQGATYVADLFDINGDGLPDRVMRRSTTPFTNYRVQLNNGLPSESGGNAFAAAIDWGPILYENEVEDYKDIRAYQYKGKVDHVDMNGDGLLDRVMRKNSPPHDRFLVQLNTGAGYGPLLNWTGVNSQGDITSTDWNSLFAIEQFSPWAMYVALIDINGDKLPDRVMRMKNSPYDKFAVQFNNGASFEPWEYWGPLQNPGGGGPIEWNSLSSSTDSNGVSITRVMLADINGDGLPDRVMRKPASPYDRFHVQLNTGSGFDNQKDWLNVASESNSIAYNSPSSVTSSGPHAETVCDLVDINGDGLVDRVVRRVSAPYDRYKVQLNEGPLPDLLSTVQNGLGGSVGVQYTPSTAWNNRDRDYTGDPWTAGAKSLLPFPVQTVTSVTVNDGMGNLGTTTYSYEGGFFDFVYREFRGFNCVAALDPSDITTRTYFHQGGGRDDSADGEWQDAYGKQGIPYLVEVEGSDQQIYKRTLNKVGLVSAHGGLSVFPQINQTIEMEYEGQSGYRATAKQFTYDAATGNLTREDNFGEVGSVNLAAHTFSDIQPGGQSDSLATTLTYTSLANPDIKSRPERIIVYSGAGAKLKERWLEYDAKGNLRFEHLWLDLGNRFVTREIQYDAYGNPATVINPVGIASTTTYDAATHTFPVTQTVGSFTTTSTFDARSGNVLTSTDPKNLVAESQYDEFFRLKKRLLSTVPGGTPSLVLEKYDYGLGGVGGGMSANYIHKQTFEPADTTEGFVHTWSYTDGLGREIQTRAESEQAGQYRVSDIAYDDSGNAFFQTLPFLSSGGAFTTFDPQRPGSLTDYDAVGRAWRVTPPAGDNGSPTAPATASFRDGSDPWAIIATDSLGKVRKSYHDAYGRVTRIIENNDGAEYTTRFSYSPTGDLTQVTDHASNVTLIAYDSLGRKTSMTDPDMGAWSYVYDDAGRLIRQTDAKTQKIEFDYLDALGRMTAKRVYDSSATLARTTTYHYDTNGGDSGYSVFPGQLFKVVDSEGWQKTSYDFRGRVLQTTRYIDHTATAYTTQSTYDEADRPLEVTYPGSTLVKVKNTYGSVGQLIKVESLAGTGVNETFYHSPLFNDLGQVTQYCYGNGLTTSFDYFANSKRLQTLRTSKPGGGYHQSLTYTYDEASNIRSIADGVYGGNAAASLNSITYDGLHRLTGFTRNGAGFTFSYDPLGNMLTNGENGGAAYTYGGARPHAVTSALGKTYGYDGNGNMTARGSQTLEYDEENRLTRVVQSAGNVIFGYADDGARLYRYSASGTTVWIGGIYEEKNGKVLCHVFADGKRVATFEPQSGLTGLIENNSMLARAKSWLTRAADWPFQQGRTLWMAMLLPLCAILGASIFFRRRDPVTTGNRPPPRSGSLLSTLNPQLSTRPAFLSPLLIVALFVATTPTHVWAATYTPVFYYYSPDHLGSSSVMTDRAGDLVQHYEYGAYGHERFVDNTSAFGVSNRYTGQVFDEETSLYYYNARYYDPELGRFTQPDTVVPELNNPQALNRYAYVLNNPLVYSDPTGHLAWFIPIIIGAVVGAAVGAATTGTVKGALLGALTGAIAGAAVAGGAALGAAAAKAIGIAKGIGIAVGTVAGGAVGGAINAAISGGNVGMGALTGAVSSAIGWGVGQAFGAIPNGGNWATFAGAVSGGALGGGVSAEIMGGNFAEGAAYGAAAAAAGWTMTQGISLEDGYGEGGKVAKLSVDVPPEQLISVPDELDLLGISESWRADMLTQTATRDTRGLERLITLATDGSRYFAIDPPAIGKRVQGGHQGAIPTSAAPYRFAGVAHNHPDSPKFSQADADRSMERLTPTYMYHKGTVSRLTPTSDGTRVVRTDLVKRATRTWW